jgi:basic membrane protein A
LGHSMSGRYVGVSAIFVIGIILIGTGLFFYFNEHYPGPNGTTTTTTTTTTEPTTTTPPPQVENPYEVAIVFVTGGLGDQGTNDACYSGALNAHSDYGINFTYVEPTSISEYETRIRSYAVHSGYVNSLDLIVCIGFDQSEALTTVAEEFPNQRFAIIDAFIDPGVSPNVASCLFQEQEGSALVGAIAGLTTRTNSIGFLGGMDIALVNRYAAGYVWGANLTSPGINHTEMYTNDWVDTTAGKALASDMYTAGVDIVFGMAGRSYLGAFDAAKDNNATSPVPLWVIGSDYPQMHFGCADPDNPLPPTVGLTSMLKRVDVAIYNIIYDAVIGTWTSSLRFFDLSNGGLGYEINTDLLTLPQSVINTVEMIKTGIINGTYVVPDSIYWM